MAISAKDFLNNPRPAVHPICDFCDKPITDVHPDEVHMTSAGKPIHDDCEFTAIGELVEAHPLCSPRAR
jgi:hypothetical protein